MNHFADRVVVVTGAGSGIGAAVAHRFAADGAAVVLVGRTREKLDRTAAAAPDGATVLARTADVTVADEVDGLIASVAADLGRLDMLVNNAGVPAFGTVEAVTPTEWRAVMAIKLDAIYHASRASIRYLRDTCGSIVNVGSPGALSGDYGMGAYNSAKGAVVNLTRAMAPDHAPEVRVNAVHPGFTLHTGITAGATPDTPVVKAFAERIPFGRVAGPEEIAGVIAFLAGPDALHDRRSDPGRRRPQRHERATSRRDLNSANGLTAIPRPRGRPHRCVPPSSARYSRAPSGPGIRRQGKCRPWRAG